MRRLYSYFSHKNTAMRCYKGCPDSDLQELLNKQDSIRKEIQSLGYSVTYFPNGEFYMAFKNYKSQTGECKTLSQCLVEIQKKLPV